MAVEEVLEAGVNKLVFNEAFLVFAKNDQIIICDGSSSNVLPSIEGHLLLSVFDGDDCLLLPSSGRLVRAQSGEKWSEQVLPIDNELIEAQYYDGSIYALDSDNNFHRFSTDECFSYARPACLQFSSPQCWCPLAGGKIIFAQQNRLFVLDQEDELVEQSFDPYGPICRLCLLKGDRIALLTSDGRLLIVHSHYLSLLADIQIEFNVLAVDSLQSLNDDIILAAQSASGRATLISLTDGEELK